MNKLNYICEVTPIARLNAVADKFLSSSNVPVEFAQEFDVLTEKDLIPEECTNRRNLLDVLCFTIDDADTKDMDDAISLVRKIDGYELSVHIADVAAYVAPGSALEAVALERGTSIYLPHKAIPMLPAVLSNELCSLKPHKERNAISIIIALDSDGNVRGYELTKSLIRSRLNGTYSEVNALLEGSCNSSLRQKYNAVADSLFEMRCLAEKLRMARVKSGANISNCFKSKPVIKNTNIIFVVEQKGAAEAIIEEFMVLANRLVAEFLKKNDLPVIFRVQHQKGRLAKYEATECHHAELALDHYVHFTSPIRRLADLKIHQVLTGLLNNMSNEELWDTFSEDMKIAAKHATRGENRSDSICKPCTAFCVGQFLIPLQNYEFVADVVGHNYQNRPIFLLNEHQLRIIGKAGLRACDGQHVALKLSVIDEQKGIVEVQSYKRLDRAVA